MKAPERPPSYMSCAELAWELSISQSTVLEMVRRKVLPEPVRLSPGCVRWSWTAVESALATLASTSDDSDPFMVGARNAIKTATEGRRGSP
jgi:predicted DNA-binding transcriptional regulator AlpA